jgi:hypothetical protein
MVIRFRARPIEPAGLSSIVWPRGGLISVDGARSPIGRARGQPADQVITIEMVPAPKNTTMSGANNLRISKMHAADPYSRSRGLSATKRAYRLPQGRDGAFCGRLSVAPGRPGAG